LAGTCCLIFMVVQDRDVQRTMMVQQKLEGDDYRDLLSREKRVLNSGAGGIDWGNERFLANAAKEQDAYVDKKNKQAAIEAKKGMEHAAKLYKRWHNPFKNSPWGKYDTEKLPVYEAPVEQLAQVEEAPSKENAFDKLHMKAVASCNGDAGCEQVLDQVMGLFGK